MKSLKKNIFLVGVLNFLAVLCSHQVLSDGHCVMRGYCGETDFGKAKCLYNGSAVPLEDKEALETLNEMCPGVMEENNSVCCDREQVRDLRSNLEVVSTLGFGRCPSCFSNFKKLFCQMVCSPKQSDFLKIANLATSDEGHLVVDSISYFLSQSYAYAMYDSCKDIRGLTPNSKTMDLLCGGWERDCTAERFLKFLGSTPDNEGFSSVEINFRLITSEGPTIVDGENFIPMNENTTLCSEIPYPDAEACDCLDCPAAC